MMQTLRHTINCILSFALFFLCLNACCDKKSVPTLSRKLYSSSAKERNDAALELARCGDAAAQAVPRLTTLLYDENIGVQSAAAYALRKIDTVEARKALDKASER